MSADSPKHPVRRVLDLVYNVCGGIAAVFTVLILAIIVAQMVARWTGFVLPGSTDYAGYCMAAASFFAFAYALNHGAHIRVNLLLTKLGRHRRWGELWCFGVGTALSGYFAFYAVKAVYWSNKLGDISQGQDATPIWIPQLAMAIGTVVLTLALADHLLRVAVYGMTDLGDEAAQDHHTE
jgi:TRAP-type C4-dicarboxylate transport system permease small subunit